jgi:hypothetical protein
MNPKHDEKASRLNNVYDIHSYSQSLRILISILHKIRVILPSREKEIVNEI